MDACAFDKLHDARDEDILAIGYGVDLSLNAIDVFVDEDRVLGIEGNDFLHEALESLFVVDDSHHAAA